MIRLFVVVFTFIYSCFFARARPSGRAYFVAPGGDDSNPGTQESPWATPSFAARQLTAGDTLYLRGGDYALTEPVRIMVQATAAAPITMAAYPGETPVLDAEAVPVTFDYRERYDNHIGQGVLMVQDAAHVLIRGLTIRNSHNGAICVRDSSHIDIINNRTQNSFGPGVGVWDTDHSGVPSHHIRVLGNTVTGANRIPMKPDGFVVRREAPHEAISIGGATHFEVAWNHVYECDKEGIDIKECSKRGTVHHNYVHHIARQAYYIDAWFGVLEHIEVYENVAHDCRLSGVAISTENVEIARHLEIHHNLLFNNGGAGIYFSRWGQDGPRAEVRIHHNTVYHNGYHDPDPGHSFYWMTGGLLFLSANVEDIEVTDNIFADNRAFAIGYSDDYGANLAEAIQARRIVVSGNFIHDTSDVGYPIHIGYEGNEADVVSHPGQDVVSGVPGFRAPANHDFTLPADDPATGFGALGESYAQWWRHDFPPEIEGA